MKGKEQAREERVSRECGGGEGKRRGQTMEKQNDGHRTSNIHQNAINHPPDEPGRDDGLG